MNETNHHNHESPLITDEINGDTVEYPTIIGKSAKIMEIHALIKKVADNDSTVIIYGESGAGKGLVAKAIHCLSERRNKPFVTINCGAIPQHLLESELFGHVKGAFTGATNSKVGKMARAHKGTVFLDEIGDMSPELQVKVLKVLEDKEIEPVGGTGVQKVDIRIIAATHRNLAEEVEKEHFREDLYYRLDVIPIVTPPLRARRADIPLLIDYYLNYFNKRNRKDLSGVHASAMKALINYSWPGNVRELKNIIERLAVLKETGVIVIEDLPQRIIRHDPELKSNEIEISEEGICLNTAVSEFEKALILQSLEKTKWVKNKAAKLLQLNRTTLVEKIKRHHLQ